MKILFIKPHRLYIPYIKQWEEENGIQVDILEENINSDNIKKLKEYDGMVQTVSNKLSDEMYQEIADYGIKQIALTSVGYEQIDLDKASQAGLIITNTPDYSPESIAEFTLMMILKALKRDKKISQNKISADYRQTEDVLGETLRGKTVGIYGLGRIGLLVAKYAKAFGASVIAHSRSPKPEASGIVDMIDSYDEVFERADIISIHSGLSDDNYHVFNKENFSKMKDGVIIINCARGGLINTSDLLDALDNGKVGFASLDVFEDERDIVGKNNPDIDNDILIRLINHENVEIYPHISYFTNTSMKNQSQFSLNSAVEVIKNGDSKNRVN